MSIKRIHGLILMVCFLLTLLSASAQERKVQNRPYTDLRPLHFGIMVGLNMQDMELENVDPQKVTVDVDQWSPGFSVGVVGDLRLSNHLNLRATPMMHFGAKHITFRNLAETDLEGRPIEQRQDMKNTYVALPIDLKFSAQRWNNYRPYLLVGAQPMINLSGKDQEYLKLKRSDLMLEVGLGCDLYLPYFKLIPELKFCYSLGNALDTGHARELKDPNMLAYTKSVSSASTKMIVLTFYFE